MALYSQWEDDARWLTFQTHSFIEGMCFRETLKSCGVGRCVQGIDRGTTSPHIFSHASSEAPGMAMLAGRLIFQTKQQLDGLP